MVHYNIKSSIQEKCLFREAKLSFVSPEESREVPVLFDDLVGGIGSG